MSPHLSESQYAPLKSGVVGEKPHSTAAGTSHGRSYLLPGSSHRVAGVRRLFVAIISLCPMERTLTHPSAACGIGVRKRSSWRFHLAAPRPWCSHIGDLRRVAGAPSPLRDVWDGAGWSLFTRQCVLSSYYRQARLETLSLTQGMKQTQSLGLSSRQWVQQSRCPSFTGPVHHPSEPMPSRCLLHLEAHLLIRTGVTHRRTKQ